MTPSPSPRNGGATTRRAVNHWPEGVFIVSDEDMTPRGTVDPSRIQAIFDRGDWHGNWEQADAALAEERAQ